VSQACERPGAGRAAAPRRARFSIEGRVVAIALCGLATQLVAARLARAAGLAAAAADLAALGVALAVTALVVRAYLRPLTRTLAALSDGIRSFQDRDFSVRLSATRADELGELLRLYNRVGDLLQDERVRIRQRELLLETALDRSPAAIVLVNPLDRVLYANPEARRLFLGGGRLAGLGFADVVRGCPAELREVLSAGTDGLFTVEPSAGEPETFHLAQRTFLLNHRRHTLLLLRRMTAELSRQEVEIWKKVIRVVSHELNNSLAPISSLAHSGTRIAGDAGAGGRLDPIFDSIRERVEHLTRFLEGYARYARLPRPRKQAVDWATWLDGPRKLFPFDVPIEPPALPGWFDPVQLEQALINLLKNAVEASAGEPEIAVQIQRLPDGAARVEVLDRGRGLAEDVLRQALLPFYSTKQAGAGVGLPLCREIVEGHGGTLRIQSRPGGGTVVSLWLPPPPA
jgi:nitrogen fixation/metabolism regulation signal transduction histidine kinase